MLEDFNNVQKTDIHDIHKHCIPLNIPYLILPWWWVSWTTFIILISKLLNAVFSKIFLPWNLIIRTKGVVTTSNESKMLSVKMGPLSLGVYLILPTTNRKGVLYFASKCKQVYSLPSHHYWQRFLALDCSSVTSSEPKIISLKMSLLSVGVAFSQPRNPFCKRLLPPGV